MTRAHAVTYTAAAVAAVAVGALLWLLNLADVQQLLWLVVVAAIGWLILDRFELLDQAKAARDDADRALGEVQKMSDHLAGAEAPSKGRHAVARSRAAIALSQRETDELPTAGVSRPGTLTRGVTSLTKGGRG